MVLPGETVSVAFVPIELPPSNHSWSSTPAQSALLVAPASRAASPPLQMTCGAVALASAVTEQAADAQGVELPRDLWHGVLFYTTGETVRRVLEEAGEPGYEPMMFSADIFGRFHEALREAWPAYLDGERTLQEAARDLIRALGGE